MAVIGFMLGGSTIVFAASSGAIKIEAFNLADGTDPSKLAKVDASGNVSVSVSNTPSVSIAGTPSVSIAGTPTVQVAHQPFQQYVFDTTSSAEACVALVVPADKRLTLQTFTGEADEENDHKPDVYLMITASQGGGASLVRPLSLVLHPSSDQWAGDVQTTLFTGTGLLGDNRTYSISACVRPSISGEFTEFRGFVSGYLDTP